MLHKIVLFNLSLFCSSMGLSQSVDSTLHSGNWSDPAIWSNGVPNATDYIKVNHNVHLDMNVTTVSPGLLFISSSGELCGDHNFTGRFIHYGPFQVGYIHATYDSSFSHNLFNTINGCTVSGLGTVWHVTPPGYGCCGCSFTCNPIIPWQSPIADFNSTTTICSGNSILFLDQSTNYPSSWAWSFPGGTPSISSQQNPTITYNQPGVYDVILIASNSIGSDTIIKVNYITVLPSPVLSLSSDTTIGYGETATLIAGGGGNYLWSTGSTNVSIIVQPSATTMYTITVTNPNGCTDIGYITVNVEPCPLLYLPNAFSPNGDGENEYLKIYDANMDCIESLQLIIYDRWGEKVYETADKNFQWDGKYAGEMQPSKVFTYYLIVKFADGQEVNKRGNISLIR